MPRKGTTKKVKESKTSNKNLSEDVNEVSDVESTNVEENKKCVSKKRTVKTKETVVAEFDTILSDIEQEITRIRESSEKQKGVKFLRTLGKRLKSLKSCTVRVMKQKKKTNRKNNTNSGFLKPVQISKDMAKFTGWDSKELRSRVDVTKYICNYIKENNLQNPKDRREIIVDKKLSKLLEYDSKKEDKPLTYYRIQTYIKKHFIKSSDK